MKRCLICGNPCRSKVCSYECEKERKRRLYRETHPVKEKPFFVFYDKNDFVRFCGTAEQLVNDGIFNRTNSVSSLACKINSGKVAGTVVILR